MSTKVSLSLILPCYNEEENIDVFLKRLFLHPRAHELEIILVNNGSTDQTERVASLWAQSYSNIRVVTVNVNQGYGFGLLSGLKEAQGDFVGWTHMDLQCPPEDVFKALDLIESAKDSEKIFIKGKREGRDWGSFFVTAFMSFYESLLFQTPLRDINAQPTFLPRSYLSRLIHPYKNSLFDLSIYYQLKLWGLSLERFPVRFERREKGQSHWKGSLFSRLRFMLQMLYQSVILRLAFLSYKENKGA